MKLENNEDFSRSQLCFASEALSNFRFLIDDYDFTCTSVDTTLVRYESEFIFVHIYHGRRSYELNVEIGKLETSPDIQENGYTIGEIMDLFEVRSNLKFTFFQASNKTQVQRLLQKLAEYVQMYAKPILEGDYEIFKKLQILRQKKSDAFIKDMNLTKSREIAEIAWKEKNYSKVIEIYESIKGDLSSIESKKLSYAMKQLHTS
jgi:hypothetical protein